MSKNHTPTTPSEPYWLIREAGKSHGFGTVTFDGNTDPEAALARIWEQEEIRPFDAEAELVVLVYVNGKPIICPVPV